MKLESKEAIEQMGDNDLERAMQEQLLLQEHLAQYMAAMEVVESGGTTGR